MDEYGEIQITDALVSYIRDNLMDEHVFLTYANIRLVLRQVNQYYADLGEEAG